MCIGRGEVDGEGRRQVDRGGYRYIHSQQIFFIVHRMMPKYFNTLFNAKIAFGTNKIIYSFHMFTEFNNNDNGHT